MLQLGSGTLALAVIEQLHRHHDHQQRRAVDRQRRQPRRRRRVRDGQPTGHPWRRTLQTSGAVTLAANRGIGLGSAASIVVTSSTDTLTYAGVIADASSGTAGSLYAGRGGHADADRLEHVHRRHDGRQRHAAIGRRHEPQRLGGGRHRGQHRQLDLCQPGRPDIRQQPQRQPATSRRPAAGAMALSGTGIQCNGNVNVTSGTLQVVNTWTGGPGTTPNTQYGFSAGAWVFAHGQHPQHRARGRAGVLRR